MNLILDILEIFFSLMLCVSIVSVVIFLLCLEREGKKQADELVKKGILDPGYTNQEYAIAYKILKEREKEAIANKIKARLEETGS